MAYSGPPPFVFSSASPAAGPSAASTSALPSDPGSPPPYTPEPDPNAAVLGRRSASSPHLQAYTPAARPEPSSTPQPRSPASSRRQSSAGLQSVPHAPSAGVRRRPVYPSADTEDDGTSESSGEDGVTYESPGPSIAGTLRERLFGKGKRRADPTQRLRPITTAHGVIGAGETETEGEDPPRHLPTARLTPSSSLSALSPLANAMSIPIPAPLASSAHRQSTIALGPLLFEVSRLLSIMPALFGTLWNAYYVLRPPQHGWGWRAEYAVCVLWSVLTGWQCLQLTTGLLKRWRAYYSPVPTLIRLLALQAICWPATQLTLTVLGHEQRPLVCWAAIGTTTCCSRAVQMWVTSNIVEPHNVYGYNAHGHNNHNNHNHSNHNHNNHAHNAHAPLDANAGLKRRNRRRWDWAAVTRACILPACAVYVVMAWAAVLRREWDAC